MARLVDLDDAMDIGTLYDWYITACMPYDEPVWTEGHIDELFNDFYVIPKEAHTIGVKPEKQDWTSVEDELPKHTGRYLVYDESGNCYDAGFDEDIGEKGEFGEWRERLDPYTLGVVDGEWISYGEITHWMPMPEFPIRKDDE